MVGHKDRTWVLDDSETVIPAVPGLPLDFLFFYMKDVNFSFI